MSFEFIATIASKLFAFKVEILENARSYPFSQIHSQISVATSLETPLPVHACVCAQLEENWE